MKLETADLEALGEGIADDNGIAMAAVGAQEGKSAALTLFFLNFACREWSGKRRGDMT